MATRWLTPAEQAAWRTFLRANALMTAEMGRVLSRDSGLSAADFSVLVVLSEHPDKQVRILELADDLQWEKSRLSHQLRRMTERGLVERADCEEDRRGAFARITPAGLRAIEAAAPGHVEFVRRTFVAPLNGDVEALTRVLGRVVDALECARADVTGDAVPSVEEPSPTRS